MPIKTFQEEPPTLNLTPMIDVVFLLIIFFMVGTKFADEERKINLQLPTLGQVAALTVAPQKRVVHVFQDGKIQLDQAVVTLHQLTDSLRQSKAQNPGLSVAVRGDASGPFQNVASVLGACREAGVQDMAISVRITR